MALLTCLVMPATPAATSDQARASASRSRYLMGTRCSGTAWGSTPERAAAALEAAFDEIARLEAILSDYRPESELSRLNRTAFPSPFSCSSDLFDFILVSTRYAKRTGGAFDITIAPLTAAWDLRGAGRIATPDQVARALERVGSGRLQLDRDARTVRFGTEGMSLDPGALGKGYALDAAASALRARGVEAAMLDFGGQVLAIGAPPGEEGWTVGVADPARRDREAATLLLRDESIATSGNAERGIEVQGRDLGHVLDPRTGAPVSTRRTASAIARSAAEADAFSTALLVMGPDEGLDWAGRQPGLAAMFLEVDGRGGVLARATPGLHYNLTPGAERSEPGSERGGR